MSDVSYLTTSPRLGAEEQGKKKERAGRGVEGVETYGNKEVRRGEKEGYRKRNRGTRRERRKKYR